MLLLLLFPMIKRNEKTRYKINNFFEKFTSTHLKTPSQIQPHTHTQPTKMKNQETYQSMSKVIEKQKAKSEKEKKNQKYEERSVFKLRFTEKNIEEGWVSSKKKMKIWKKKKTSLCREQWTLFQFFFLLLFISCCFQSFQFILTQDLMLFFFGFYTVPTYVISFCLIRNPIPIQKLLK